MNRLSVRRVVAASAVMLLAACGGGGSSSPKSAATEEALEEAVAAFGDAVLQGEMSSAYAYFTKECRETVPKTDFVFMSQMGIAFLEGMAEVDASDLRTANVEIRNFTPTSAEARAEIRDKNGDLFSDADSEGWSGWQYEDGGWHTSDCADFDSEGMGFTTDGGDAFSYPACSELVDGQPLPDEFGSGSEIDLSCEDGENLNFGYTTSCFTSTREYAENDLGYVFLDEGVFYEGDVRGCAPQCSDLVDGQPVPTDFDDESTAGFNLNCERPSGEASWSFEWECFDSDRMYVENDDGYAFVDDRIFVAGDPEYC